MLDTIDQQNQRTERLRGWIILLLYKSGNDPTELATLLEALDAQNYPLTRRRLADQLNYLRQKRLIDVFWLGGGTILDRIEQSKLLQAYANTDNDSELPHSPAVLLTDNGVDFQERRIEIPGVTRVR